jgi:hypothetical protein
VGEHFDEAGALFLAALSAQDPERAAAEAHAAQCDRCRVVWQESLQLLVLLDREATTEPVSPALLQRVQSAIESAAPRPWYRRWTPWGWLSGAIASLALFAAQHGAPVPRGMHAEHAAGWACARFELGFGAAAFVLGLVAARYTARQLGPARASLAAMSGALVGQWLLRSHCEFEQTALHLLLFHVAGVAVSALLGAGAGALQHSSSAARG